MAKTKPAEVAGMVRLAGAPCSVGGVAYMPGDDGTIMVPAHAAAHLIEAHGFRAPGEMPVDRDYEAELVEAHLSIARLEAAVAAKAAADAV